MMPSRRTTRPLRAPPESSPVKRRRLAAQHVRDARDRLTSTTGTRPAFDYELLRQFAQNRLSASLVDPAAGRAPSASCRACGPAPVTAGAWTAAVLVIHAVIITKCRQFLDRAAGSGQRRAPGALRFIMLDLFFGLAWMFILIHPVGVDEGSGTFMLFVMLLVVAVSSMLASSAADRGVRRDRPGHRGDRARLRAAAARCTTTSSPSWR